jgi:hypothetical protein
MPVKRAKCIQECFDGARALKYMTDGGKDKDGFYDDIDPLEPIAQYFEFPPGTVKYVKILGNKRLGTDNVITTVKVPGDVEPETDAELEELKAKLKEKGVPFHPKTGKEKLKVLLEEAE